MPSDKLADQVEASEPTLHPNASATKRGFVDVSAAQRALAEAEVRRAARVIEEDRAREVAGRGGLEPVRYGDWEVKGLATDF